MSRNEVVPSFHIQRSACQDIKPEKLYNPQAVTTPINRSSYRSIGVVNTQRLIFFTFRYLVRPLSLEPYE